MSQREDEAERMARVRREAREWLERHRPLPLPRSSWPIGQAEVRDDEYWDRKVDEAVEEGRHHR